MHLHLLSIGRFHFSCSDHRIGKYTIPRNIQGKNNRKERKHNNHIKTCFMGKNGITVQKTETRPLTGRVVKRAEIHNCIHDLLARTPYPLTLHSHTPYPARRIDLIMKRGHGPCRFQIIHTDTYSSGLLACKVKSKFRLCF